MIRYLEILVCIILVYLNYKVIIINWNLKLQKYIYKVADIFLGNKVTTISIKNILTQRLKKLVKTPSDVITRSYHLVIYARFARLHE